MPTYRSGGHEYWLAVPVEVTMAHHQEIWVPAEEQCVLVSAFTSRIRVLSAEVGPRLVDVLPAWNGSSGRTPDDDLAALMMRW